MSARFVGRKRELDALRLLTRKRGASLVVITGRRRIGKSRLIDEFAARNARYRRVFISALAPGRGITPATQRAAFAEQLQLALELPQLRTASWFDLFVHLARGTERGRWLILLDEVSWMGSRSPDFLPKLKILWDQYLSKNPQLILVLCGSVSSWLDENILASTGFVGRVSLSLRVDELPLNDCNAFWGGVGERISAYDKLKLLAVTGGVPRYLEEIVAGESADENLRRLCFTPEGLLFREFDQIFSALFDRRASIYRDIVDALGDGHLTLQQLCDRLRRQKGGAMSRYLDELTLAGFVSRDFTWDIRRRIESKLSRFRLKDNYLRFYLRQVRPNRRRIEARRMKPLPVTAIPGWDAMMALQFENLVLHNREAIWHRCGVSASEIELDGSYFQSTTKRQRGCQVDYLIQTVHGPLYVCEIKYSRKRLGRAVEDAVREKIRRLALPRHCSVLPVLVHVGEVSESIGTGDFFARVVDFTELLT